MPMTFKLWTQNYGSQNENLSSLISGDGWSPSLAQLVRFICMSGSAWVKAPYYQKKTKSDDG